MATGNAMLEGVKSRLRPKRDETEQIEAIRKFVFSRLEKVIPKDVEIGLMGSVSKGTNLSGNRELDIFLLVPRKLSHERMTTLGLSWAKKAMKGEKTEIGYANHPYLKVRKGGFKIDIVPSYKIENAEKLGSAVDRSQLHTKYVNSHLSESQKDGVRLLKQFAKTLGVYGAELRVEGFSGYLCEILVMKYGSFDDVLAAAAKWGKRPTIDIEGGRGQDELCKLFDAPLIVIDPVDRKRNVSAVVSQTSLSRFILAARQYVKKPSPEFFLKEKEVHSVAALRKMIAERDTASVALFFKPPELVEDILWPQLKKTTLALIAHIERAEFRVFGHYFWSDGERALIFIELMKDRLPGVIRRQGPAVWFEKDVDAFIAKHSRAMNLHLEHEKIVAVEKRAVRTPEQAIKAALSESETSGIPPKFAIALKRAKYGKSPDLLKGPYAEVASDYFSRHI